VTGAGFAAIQLAVQCGNLREAERLAGIAQDAIEPNGLEAVQLANLRGGLAFESGRLDEAERRFEQAIRLAIACGAPELAAKATTNLGSVAHLRGKVSLAADLYHGALESYRARRDPVGLARTEHNLGIVRRELGALDEASGHATRALRMARLAGDSALLATALMGAAETAIAQGKYGAARRLMVEARHHARAIEDRIALAELLRLRGFLAWRLLAFEASLERCREGYLAAIRLGTIQLAGECAALASRAASRLSRPKLARALRARAERCFRSLGAQGALQRLAEDLES